ncbi:MAG: hypothetical protein L6266_04740 [Nanoarchaeota archaeon]|nr:hypothetical protein [Nanoarchaeota archaeon]
MKKNYREQIKSNEPELKTEVIKVTPGYWTGRIHRADGSIVNVEVKNIEYLLKRCEEKSR